MGQHLYTLSDLCSIVERSQSLQEVKKESKSFVSEQSDKEDSHCFRIYKNVYLVSQA